MYYTYLHCKPDGTPFYVGKGADRYVVGHGTDRRSHSKKNRSEYHKNTTAKYGWENILVYVFPCDSEAQALTDEIQQIAQLQRAGYALCNLTDGGEGCSGLVHTFETRRKLSITSAGNRNAAYPCPSDRAAKISATLTGRLGNKNWLGHKHSEETRAKMSAARVGKSVAHKGKPWSEARRAAQEKRSLILEKVS